MISKIFSPKNFAKILAFLLKLLLDFAKIVIITLVFEKNTNFSPKIGKKLSKIVIITLVLEKNTNLFAENWQKIVENCDHNIGFREKHQFIRRKLAKNRRKL
jgi:hypothetical protein